MNDPGSRFCVRCGSPMKESNQNNSMMSYGVSPMLVNNGMNTPKPIKPKKNPMGLIVLFVVISAIVMSIFAIFLVFTKSSSDENEIVAETVVLKPPFDEYEIAGGWNSVDEGGTYWKFEDGQYWWYKSYDDLDDNYWYGSIEVYTGKEGLNIAGLEEEKVDAIAEQSGGNVTADDIYTVVCTPEKVISGGVDKSDVNITEEQTLTYVWILVNYDDGIEAQVLNLQNYDVGYYMKIEE